MYFVCLTRGARRYELNYILEHAILKNIVIKAKKVFATPGCPPTGVV